MPRLVWYLKQDATRTCESAVERFEKVMPV